MFVEGYGVDAQVNKLLVRLERANEKKKIFLKKGQMPWRGSVKRVTF